MSNNQLGFDRMREREELNTPDEAREAKEAYSLQQADDEQPGAENPRPTGEQRARGNKDDK